MVLTAHPPHTTRRHRARTRRGCRPPDYQGHFVVKTITTAGTFRSGKRLLYLANALTNQRIGMEETDDGLWAIYFHTVLLATFDERDYIIQCSRKCYPCCRTLVLPMFPIIHRGECPPLTRQLMP